MIRLARHRRFALGLLALAGLGCARASDDFYDRVASALTFSSADALFRTRLSGTLELEGYALPQPSPGLLYTSGHALFNPRLVLFLDAQLGPDPLLGQVVGNERHHQQPAADAQQTGHETGKAAHSSQYQKSVDVHGGRS